MPAQNSPGLLPGAEIGYDQITASVNITATSEATANALITCAAHYFDGGPVLLQVYAPFLYTATVASNAIGITLSEGGSVICELAFIRPANVAPSIQHFPSCFASFRFTPTAGMHTYVIGGYTASTTGTPGFGAGTGTALADVPAYARFTKV